MDKKKRGHIVLIVLLLVLIVFHATAHILTYGIFHFQEIYSGAGALYIDNSYHPIFLNFQEIKVKFSQYEIVSLGIILLELIAILAVITRKRLKIITARLRRLSLAKDQNEPRALPLENKTERSTSKSKTDLDSLYSELKEKKRIKISSISKAFKISKELALEWAKILESGDLASIQYSNISEPQLVLNESEKKENK